MSDQRRARLRLEISREAARLFWEQGVAATGGDQIAAAVGLSTRSIWRHFRSKEACAEPIVMRGVVTLLDVLRRWPRDTAIEDHLLSALARLGREGAPVTLDDEMLAMKMIRLGDSEPAIRSTWLMACDQTEREMRTILADRLRRSAEELEVRQHAAAVTSAIRVLDEHVGAAILAGEDLTSADDVERLTRRYAQAIRTATGGAIGDPTN